MISCATRGGGRRGGAVRLYSVSKEGKAKEIDPSAYQREKDLQKLIEENMEVFFGVTCLSSEWPIGKGRVDTIGIDGNGCPVIFEYKRSMNDAVVTQTLSYLKRLLDSKGDFEILVRDKLKRENPRIDWSKPRLICIASDFGEFDIDAASMTGQDMRLFRYRKYGVPVSHILFECIYPPQPKKGKIRPEPDSGLDKGLPSPEPDHGSRFDRDYCRAPAELRSLYDSLREHLLSLGGGITEMKQPSGYVAFRKPKSAKPANFACVYIDGGRIRAFVKLAPESVKLVDGLVEDPGPGHWPGKLRLVIRDESDFEACRDLILKSYLES